MVAPVNISITVIPKALKYGHDIGSQAPISAQSHGQEVEARYGVEKNGPGKKKGKTATLPYQTSDASLKCWP